MKTITLEDLDAYLGEPDEAPNVKPASAFADQVIDRLYGPEKDRADGLPWNKGEGTIEFRPGEVSLWLGMNGHGKSLMLGQLLIGWMTTDSRCCIASMEMKPVVTLTRMTKQAGMCDEPSISFIKQFHGWTDDRLWMYDQQGTVKADRMLSVVRYFADKLKGNHFVIDSLMKCGIPEDDYNGQKRFVDELCSIARDKSIHIHLVHHSRKLQDEHSPPGKMDAKGSGAITDQVDNCITVWRNKRKENDVREGKPATGPDAVMIVDKQRNGEWEGRLGLWFHVKSGQFLGFESAKPHDLIRIFE